MTKALISVSSATRISSRMREREPAAQAFTYSARTESGRATRLPKRAVKAAASSSRALAATAAESPPPRLAPGVFPSPLPQAAAAAMQSAAAVQRAPAIADVIAIESFSPKCGPIPPTPLLIDGRGALLPPSTEITIRKTAALPKPGSRGRRMDDPP
jgi:hypothetical protein